jgi:hypothetical protein
MTAEWLGSTERGEEEGCAKGFCRSEELDGEVFLCLQKSISRVVADWY